MDSAFHDFFPAGFWPAVAMVGMVLFLVFGADLLFGSKLVTFLGRVANRKIQVDQLIIQALSNLKKASDKEFDMDKNLLYGWGRFVLSGLLFFGAALILINLLPRLH